MARITPDPRAWPITEAIKANVAEAERAREGAEGKAAVLAEASPTLSGIQSPRWVD